MERSSQSCNQSHRGRRKSLAAPGPCNTSARNALPSKLPAVAADEASSRDGEIQLPFVKNSNRKWRRKRPKRQRGGGSRPPGTGGLSPLRGVVVAQGRGGRRKRAALFQPGCDLVRAGTPEGLPPAAHPPLQDDAAALVLPTVPYVLTNLTGAWPARRKWSREGFVALFGHVEVPLRRAGHAPVRLVST